MTVTKNQKISFCTVCMNRLHHLKETLPENIKNNSDYPKIEFVVLDYNSQDGLSDWMYKNMTSYISGGILKFYRTNQPDSFVHSLAKNAVSKLATGDVICNIDADNYTGKNFAEYINQKFLKDKNIYLYISKNIMKRDNLGRICMKTIDFKKLTGYDEAMNGYGFEDVDLVNRLELLGLKKIEIENANFLNAIPHDDKERLKFEKNSIEIKEIFINRCDYKSVQILYLFNDLKYSLGTVKISKLENSLKVTNFFRQTDSPFYEFALKDNYWEKGTYEYKGDQLKFNTQTQCSLKSFIGLIEDNNAGKFLKVDAKKYHKTNDNDLILSLKMFYSQISNRIKMEYNKNNKILNVNNNGFGKIQLVNF